MLVVSGIVVVWSGLKLGNRVNIAVIMPIFIQLLGLSVWDRELTVEYVTLPCLARLCRKLHFYILFA